MPTVSLGQGPTYLVWRTHPLLCEPNPLLCFRKAAVRNRDQRLSGFRWSYKTSAWEHGTPRCLPRSSYSAAPSPGGSWSASSRAAVPSHPYFIPSGGTSVLAVAGSAQGSILSGLPVEIKGGMMLASVQFSSVTQSCRTLCDPMDCSTPGFPVHHQLPELTQTHVHWVGDAIQPSHPLSALCSSKTRWPP